MAVLNERDSPCLSKLFIQGRKRYIWLTQGEPEVIFFIFLFFCKQECMGREEQRRKRLKTRIIMQIPTVLKRFYKGWKQAMVRC